MISEIYIKNFRSIKEITLNPSNLTALIGPNSTGKTNILKAIDLVLGEGWTTKAKVARELFNNPNQDIVIEIDFDVPVLVPSSGGYRPTEVSSVRLCMSLTPDLNARTTINGGETFYSHESFKKLCHFIYIPSYRNLASELRVSEWTMLGKMMRLIYENYISFYDYDENKLRADFKEKMSSAKEFLENDFSEDVTFKKFSDKFKEKCTQNSLGLAIDFKPVLDIYNLNWFYKTLQIHVQEDIPNKYFDSEEVGTGMQNLLMLSVFQTYSELVGGKVIFGIEEPEIYLYPQAQRSLYKNFVLLSENTQIFYTTHNTNFVSAARPDDMQLLRRDLRSGTFKLNKNPDFNTINAETEKYKYKIYTQFNQERNEMFFAKKVIFVEGASDKILFSKLCSEKWNIELNDLGISIIECGGKGGVNYFVGVSKLIGFDDFFAVWDEDPNGETYKPSMDFLPQIASERKGLEIPQNLEKFLNLPTNNSDKVKNSYEWAMNIDSSKIPKEFETVKQFLDAIDNEITTIETGNSEEILLDSEPPF